jgi:hypothetical protein
MFVMPRCYVAANSLKVSYALHLGSVLAWEIKSHNRSEVQNLFSNDSLGFGQQWQGRVCKCLPKNLAEQWGCVIARL